MEQPFPVRLRVQSRIDAPLRRLHLCSPAAAAAAPRGGAEPSVMLQVRPSGVRVVVSKVAQSACGRAYGLQAARAPGQCMFGHLEHVCRSGDTLHAPVVDWGPQFGGESV